MQLRAVLFLLATASTLYMFRTLSAPIIRSTKTVVTATGACRESGWCLQPTLDIFTRYTSPRLVTGTSGCYYSF